MYIRFSSIKKPIVRNRVESYPDWSFCVFPIDVGTFTDPNSHLEKGFYHIITGCLSKGRQPRLVVQSSDGTSKMSCDNHGATIKVADLDSSIGTEALKIIPFPEPGLWYIGFQLDCRNTTTGDLISCPESSVSAMVSVDVNIQPCDYRPLQTGINLILELLIFIWISVYYTFLYT